MHDEAVRARAFEEAIAIVEAQRVTFKDPAYAGGPVGAFCELFACNEIIMALRDAASRTLPPANTEADVERADGVRATDRKCAICRAIVCASPEAMCCHCGELPWPIDPALSLTRPAGGEEVERLRKTLEPFAAMGRVMETRAIVTFGKMPADQKVVCESSGEAGLGILTMGHFRDAAALLPTAQGWTGMYRPPFDRAALATPQQVKEGGRG